MTSFLPTSDALSWGRTPRVSQNVARPNFADELRPIIVGARELPGGLLAAGLRRSYGDSCLNDGGAVIDMGALDRFVSFDRATGRLVAEAGVSLADILRVAVPAGFFLPVTPGTKFVTLGGAIANDVHGKNHHRAGTFGRWVRRLTLIRSDGAEHELSDNDATGLFAATVGGLGLTGIIAQVEVQLQPIASSMMEVETIPFGNVSEFFRLAEESDATHDYTVAWVDCLSSGRALGRGVFSRARHSGDGARKVDDKRTLSVPIDAPGFLLNRFSLSTFNALYYRLAGRRRRTTVSYNPFFYPLDAIGGWNRLYGRQGFYQYQSVVPPAVAQAATVEMLKTISSAGQGSFLAVLKTFGDVPSSGLLSFPMKGTTLALDFANRGPKTLALLDRLDAIVREAGGRLYPAKDARLPAHVFRAGYPGLSEFARHRDPGLSSSFSRRLEL